MKKSVFTEPVVFKEEPQKPADDITGSEGSVVPEKGLATN